MYVLYVCLFKPKKAVTLYKRGERGSKTQTVLLGQFMAEQGALRTGVEFVQRIVRQAKTSQPHA